MSTSDPANPVTPDWDDVRATLQNIRLEIGRVIIGQDDVVEELLTCLLCKGHALLIGVPGLAKTLLINTLGQVLGLSFHRIQFTPDLMPTDILGSEILQTHADGMRREFEFVHGPVFANLILADEINRTPPKTQSALLEAMQEKQVTVAGKTLSLPSPFIVFATQNPIEQEGTYPLPEAQLDRFLYSLNVGYPTREEEKRIVQATIGEHQPEARSLLKEGELETLQAAATRAPLPDPVLDMIINLVHATRPGSETADEYVKHYVAWGAGPRASQNLARAARALALIRGKAAATAEELHAVAAPVLRHRVVPNYNAVGEGVSVEEIIATLLKRLD
ncbi:MAG: AAA family ATPase [Verrucomicrobia bacterium]|nr:AAA family ATPase [Verrucomicrobiota bacterium]MCH8526339.1 AAA family ATPase [Kiritimatiellia bacterium]